ncbi:PREDICTED: F-box/LRR-repeat protein At1g67190-like [Tarenaya hassleriana]|uniref:F-box/LRR-repeat protein At1g67190-like n=1 Tax=Tarenaya hassleriana TaxID=28532 RepID=UPI00053C2A90|nr:PREDICTED: F-box/LRR-repeat protein At1g67190-like [Tarenaya hassleriana]
MENLPVELIGNILSHLDNARDVVIASTTSKRWREAYHHHLHQIAFVHRVHPFPWFYDTRDIERVITHTLTQTTGVQELTIEFEDDDGFYRFRNDVVTEWLGHTRETLRRLCFNAGTTRGVNVLASLGALQLNLLLSACPQIEKLELVNHHMIRLGWDVPVICPGVKNLLMERIRSNFLAEKQVLVVEAGNLECLSVNDCALHHFKLTGNGTPKHLRIDDSSIWRLDIAGAAEKLESVDFRRSAFVYMGFTEVISTAPQLMTLSLWDVKFDTLGYHPVGYCG